LKSYIQLQEAKTLLMPVNISKAIVIEIVVKIVIAMATIKALAKQLANHLIQPANIEVLRVCFQNLLSAA
jgi:hypothetical protein